VQARKRKTPKHIVRCRFLNENHSGQMTIETSGSFLASAALIVFTALLFKGSAKEDITEQD
jgi:hypothetical protein